MECPRALARRSRMVRACWLLVVSACFRGAPTPPPPAIEPPAPNPAVRSIDGEYVARHEIQLVCDGEPDGWCMEQVEDTMTIRERANNGIAVALELVRTNAHTCSFEGALERTLDGEGSTRRWQFQAEDEEFPCSLVLEQARGRVTIRADGCREYCGARASLDAEFDFPPRSSRHFPSRN